ncbi:serine/threonine-protein kinase meng-po isoform X2 [Episyrphus balteatus]|uniref:serine/threonine-protein kinase meng-po isoform X2 n=1 Tax=Episyrphus balteatus TaxID=286459 RepID=UPI002486B4F9|nr:serine/threonine-protein kinase meng-po isoform X2 [Episyrphus balteatus]
MSVMKKPRGSIHKIREFELEKIHLVDEFDILQIVGEGWFGKILLVEHRASQTEMVLKAVPKPYVSLRDFYREFHYGLHLGIHRNIVTTYDVAFETAGFYVFTQEYAPLGDLTSNVTDSGIGELHSKRVAKQIACALDYMHTKDIVHRDVKLDNVLIYRSDFSRVKLCDFGESYQTDTTVERRNEWLPYSPPEVLQIKPESTYKADPSHDVWQFGIVIFVCLTGCLPWQKAASDDPRYMRYLTWQNTLMLPIRRTPKLFKLLASKSSRMFRRFLEPRPERRPKNLADLAKFIDDRWLAKTAEKEMAEYETDELCPSMYSFHSSPDEKHRLLHTLVACGIESNVDRTAKKNRIKDWIESSIITEEDENEEENESASASPSSSVSRGPVAGHISSIRTVEPTKKEIKTTLKDANQKHFDPRTGALQQGPSSMGTVHPSPSPPGMNSLNTSTDSLKGSILTLGSRNDLLSSDFHLYASEMNMNALVKDSGYGSTTTTNGDGPGTKWVSQREDVITNDRMRANRNPMNGKTQQQSNHTNSGGFHSGASMKDTPYDRFAISKKK